MTFSTLCPFNKHFRACIDYPSGIFSLSILLSAAEIEEYNTGYCTLQVMKLLNFNNN